VASPPLPTYTIKDSLEVNYESKGF